MHQRSVWRIRSYKRSPFLAGAQKSSRAEHHMRSFDRRRSGTATGMLNDGLPRVKRSEIFCRKTPSLHFLHHVQWRILGCRPPYPCARGAGSCNLKDASYDSPWRALRTICPIFLARGHLFCRSAGSQAVTVFTDTKLVPSADAALKVLETVFPLPLVLLASFFGGVVVAARSRNGL